jgi:hypothetical protein
VIGENRKRRQIHMVNEEGEKEKNADKYSLFGKIRVAAPEHSKILFELYE